MLNEIHRAVRQLIHTRGRIDPLDVDVKFESPLEDWVNSLTRPTINLFLYDLRENTDKRETNVQVVRGTGKAARRVPSRRIDVSYMVSALTGDVEDEHELLWRVLGTLMKYREFPQELMEEPFRSIEPPITTRVASHEESRGLLELWNALGTKPHPAICYIATAPLDLELTFEVPLVLTRTARYRRSERATPEIVVQIGGVVRDSQGRPVPDAVVKSDSKESRTNPEGQYVLRDVCEGPITLSVLRKDRLKKKVEVTVPAASYDIVVDE